MNNREKADRQIKAAQELLYSKPVESSLVERWFLLDEACERYASEPQPLALGKGMQYVLERASLPINPCDLLLGRYIDRVPTGEEQVRLEEIWERRVRRKNPVTYWNQGHLTLQWEELVRVGITGYEAAAGERLRRAEREGVDEGTLHFLQGMQLVYRSIRTYIGRYAQAAEQAGMPEQAEVCRRLTVSPPASFREALQLVLFVFTVYLIYGGWRVACLTLGRMDRYLLPFYRADLAAGRSTPEEMA